MPLSTQSKPRFLRLLQLFAATIIIIDLLLSSAHRPGSTGHLRGLRDPCRDRSLSAGALVAAFDCQLAPAEQLILADPVVAVALLYPRPQLIKDRVVQVGGGTVWRGRVSRFRFRFDRGVIQSVAVEVRLSRATPLERLPRFASCILRCVVVRPQMFRRLGRYQELVGALS